MTRIGYLLCSYLLASAPLGSAMRRLDLGKARQILANANAREKAKASKVQAASAEDAAAFQMADAAKAAVAAEDADAAEEADNVNEAKTAQDSTDANVDEKQSEASAHADALPQEDEQKASDPEAEKPEELTEWEKKTANKASEVHGLPGADASRLKKRRLLAKPLGVRGGALLQQQDPDELGLAAPELKAWSPEMIKGSLQTGTDRPNDWIGKRIAAVWEEMCGGLRSDLKEQLEKSPYDFPTSKWFHTFEIEGSGIVALAMGELMEGTYRIDVICADKGNGRKFLEAMRGSSVHPMLGGPIALEALSSVVPFYYKVGFGFGSTCSGRSGQREDELARKASAVTNRMSETKSVFAMRESVVARNKGTWEVMEDPLLSLLEAVCKLTEGTCKEADWKLCRGLDVYSPNSSPQVCQVFTTVDYGFPMILCNTIMS